MANKQISQLPAASVLQNSDLLVAEQNGVAKSVTGTVLLAMLDGHGGISSTSYTAPVAPSLQGTLTLTFADGASTSIPIYNGAQGAQGAQGTQGERGAAFTYSDFTPEQLESLRGEQGIQGIPGNPGYVHIKWSSVEPTSDADMGDIPDDWIGIYSGSSSTAPTAYTAYAWYKIKGETGARGFTGARGANGTKIYLSNAAPIFYDNYYYFGLSQLVAPDGQLGVSPDSGDLILYRNSYYSSTGITDSLRGVRCIWGYDIVLSTATDEQVQDAVDEYLSNHPTVTGTFTNEAKNALIALLEKVAYIDGNGQTYLDTLTAELFAVSVTSISAVFTQGSAVIYDTDSLDTLKQYLVVTANYSDSTTATVTDYTLSGTLTEGTSTITVSYGGETTTFDVTVTAHPILPTEYQQVEYIENPSDAYIVTTIPVALENTVHVKSLLSAKPSATANVCGGTSNGQNRAYVSYSTSNNYVGAWVGNTNCFPLVTDLYASVLESWTITHLTSLYFHGVNASIEKEKTQNVSSGGLTACDALELFRAGSAGGAFTGRIYYLEVLNGETPTAQLYPCYRKSDNKVGVYDLVNSKFYTSANSTALTKGADV